MTWKECKEVKKAAPKRKDTKALGDRDRLPEISHGQLCITGPDSGELVRNTGAGDITSAAGQFSTTVVATRGKSITASSLHMPGAATTAKSLHMPGAATTGSHTTTTGSHTGSHITTTGSHISAEMSGHDNLGASCLASIGSSPIIPADHVRQLTSDAPNTSHLPSVANGDQPESGTAGSGVYHTPATTNVTGGHPALGTADTGGQLTPGAAGTGRHPTPGAAGTGGQLIPGAAVTGGQITPAAAGTGGQLTPDAAGTGGQLTPGAAGTGGQLIPGSAGTGGQLNPGAAGTDGQLTPGAASTGGQLIPGAAGTDGQLTPGAAGTGGQLNPGQLNPGAAGTGGQFTPGAAGFSGQHTPGAAATSVTGGHPILGAAGTGGQLTPGTAGTGRLPTPGATGTGGQLTPGAAGTGGQLNPGAAGTGGQLTPGAAGSSVQHTPGAAGPGAAATGGHPRHVTVNTATNSDQCSTSEHQIKVLESRVRQLEIESKDFEREWCRRETRLKNEMLIREAEINAKDKKSKAMQKELEAKEKDLNSREMQLQAGKANQTGLEKKIKELQEENRILRERLLAVPTTPQPAAPSGNQVPTETRNHNMGHERRMGSADRSEGQDGYSGCRSGGCSAGVRQCSSSHDTVNRHTQACGHPHTLSRSQLCGNHAYQPIIVTACQPTQPPCAHLCCRSAHHHCCEPRLASPPAYNNCCQSLPINGGPVMNHYQSCQMLEQSSISQSRRPCQPPGPPGLNHGFNHYSSSDQHPAVHAGPLHALHPWPPQGYRDYLPPNYPPYPATSNVHPPNLLPGRNDHRPHLAGFQQMHHPPVLPYPPTTLSCTRSGIKPSCMVLTT